MIWFALAIVAVIIELFTNTFYLLVLSIALILTGLMNYFLETTLTLNLIVCAILVFIGTVGVTWFHLRKRDVTNQQKDIKDGDLDIGQFVHIESVSKTGLLNISYRGTMWQAKSNNLKNQEDTIGKTGVIVAREGNTFVIDVME